MATPSIPWPKCIPGQGWFRSKTGLISCVVVLELEMTRVSSKGQIVIPGLIREKLGLKNGSRLLVFGEGDTIILKKVGWTPSSATDTLTSIRKKIRALGLAREDMDQEVRRVRARHAKTP